VGQDCFLCAPSAFSAAQRLAFPRRASPQSRRDRRGYAEKTEIRTTTHSQLLVAVAAVILFEFAVDGLSPNAQGFGGVSLVATGVVKRGFDRLAFNLIH
jgi:hypothetical protein